jgi:mono/diheme cytochrome c family protein
MNSILCNTLTSSAIRTENLFTRRLLGASLLIAGFVLLLGTSGCTRHQQKAEAGSPKGIAFGAAIIEVGGGKQITPAGTALPEPVVVQVNDEQGTAVAGALVSFRGAHDVSFDPPTGVTDSSGQFTTTVTLGESAGRYQISAVTTTKTNKPVELKLDEIALGYQQVVGQRLNDQYCDRCHNQESSAEKVSNYDNLEVKPHAFTDGDTLNKMSDADIVAIISHGGPALNKSAQMPPYGYTLSKSEIQALIAYIREISDPPYRTPGTVYAKNQ